MKHFTLKALVAALIATQSQKALYASDAFESSMAPVAAAAPSRTAPFFSSKAAEEALPISLRIAFDTLRASGVDLDGLLRRDNLVLRTTEGGLLKIEELPETGTSGLDDILRTLHDVPQSLANKPGFKRADFEPMDMSFSHLYHAVVVDILKTRMSSAATLTDLIPAYFNPHQNLSSLAHGVLEYMTHTIPESAERNDVMEKMGADARENNLSIAKLGFYLYAMQGVQGKMTEYEVNSLQNALFELEFMRDAQNNDWENFMKRVPLEGEEKAKLEFLSNFLRQGIHSNHGSEDYRYQEIESRGFEYNSLFTASPVFGKSILGVHFITNEFLRGKSAAAFTLAGLSTKAHGYNSGEGMSPVMFSLHDVAHKSQAATLEGGQISEKVGKAYDKIPGEFREKGLHFRYCDELEAITRPSFYEELLLAKKMLQSLLYFVDQKALTDVLTPKEHREFIMPLFLAMHELYSYAQVDHFENFDEFLEKVFGSLLNQLKSQSQLSEDPFKVFLKRHPMDKSMPAYDESSLREIFSIDPSDEIEETSISYTLVSLKTKDKGWMRRINPAFVYENFEDIARTSGKLKGYQAPFSQDIDAAFVEFKDKFLLVFEGIEERAERFKAIARLVGYEVDETGRSIASIFNEELKAIQEKRDAEIAALLEKHPSYSMPSTTLEESSAVVLPAVEVSGGLDVAFDAPGYSLSYVVDSISFPPTHKFISVREVEEGGSPRTSHLRSLGGDKTVLFDLHSALTLEEEGSNRYRISLSELAAVAGADESKE